MESFLRNLCAEINNMKRFCLFNTMPGANTLNHLFSLSYDCKLCNHNLFVISSVFNSTQFPQN